MTSINLVANISQQLQQRLRQKMVGDAAILSGASYLSALIGLLTTVVATRLLPPNEYGRAALIMSYPMLLWSCASLKPASVATRYIAAYRAAGQHTLLLSVCKLGYLLDLLAATAVVGVICATGWWVSSAIYQLPGSTWPMIGFAVLLPLSALMGTSQAILSSWQAFRWIALFYLFDRILTLGLLIGLVLAGAGATGMVMAIALGQAVTGVVMTITAAQIMRRDGPHAWWAASLSQMAFLRREITSFFGWNYILVTLTGIVLQVPLMILNRARGPEAAGYYRLATTIVTVGAYIEQSLTKIAYSTLSARLGSAEPPRFRPLVQHWTVQVGLPAASIVLVSIGALPVLIPLVFGSAYAPMVVGAQILMVPVVLRTLCFWLSPYYMASGQIARFTIWYGVYTIITVFVGWWSILVWGFVGLSLVVAAGSIALLLILIGSMVWRPDAMSLEKGSSV